MYSIQIAQKCPRNFVQNYNRKRLDKSRRVWYNISTVKERWSYKMTIKELIIKYMNYLEMLEGITDTKDYICTSDFEDMCDVVGYNGTAIVKVIDNMYLYCNSREVKANRDTIIDLMIKLAK